MLTAIGRAAARHLLVRALPSAAIPRCQPVVRAACRSFSTSRLTRLVATASPTTTKKTKKATATKEEGAAKKKKETTTAKKTAAVKKPKAKKQTASELAPKPKKELTSEEQLKLNLKELKKAALLSEPKKLTNSGFQVYLSDNFAGRPLPPGETMAQRTQALSQSFKNLSSDELQRLEERAKENRLANDAAYKAWVESHTPVAIAEANTNRLRIRRLTGKLSPRKINDERLPKKPSPPFIWFSKVRRETGEFGGSGPSSARALSEEWKKLPEAEKRAYEDMAQAETEQYTRDMLSILGRHVRNQPARSK